MGYKDILKRNDELIDNLYDVQDEVVELANENEYLDRENEDLYQENIEVTNHNEILQDGINDLHRASRRKGRHRATKYQQVDNKLNQCGYTIEKDEEKPQCPLQPKKEKVDRMAVSLYLSEHAKNILIFISLIFLILLLGLGIDPNTAMNYQTILDLYLELVFNLYNIVVLGCIGVLLRVLWKKINKK